MNIGVVIETQPGERRVAIAPVSAPALRKAGATLTIQAGAGEHAGFSDSEYQARGASIARERAAVLAGAEVVCRVRTPAAADPNLSADLAALKPQATLIGLADPLGDPASIQRLARTGARTFALELLPRITRAQTMDVLSSQATVSGYQAVMLAARACWRMFPLMTTAAGTITPAKVFVIGAGVAGLQAIATARRLGAVVLAYDVRPAVKEQVHSLGARFLEMPLPAESAEGAGGYAKAMGEEFYRRQRELMTKAVAEHDVVITTATVPGAPPPRLITAEMAGRMQPGSVIIDLAARVGSAGGNCELTRPDESVTERGVTILGPTNLPAACPHTASQLFSRNMTSFLLGLIKDGAVNVNMDDEIIAATLITDGGRIVNQRVQQLLESSP